MDAERFDNLARGLLSEISRRRGIGALLAGTLGPLGFTMAEAKRGRNKKKRRKRKKKRKQKRKKRPCYPGTNCVPGPDTSNARCDFADSVRFFELDVQGAELREANFTGAQLARANLAGADLSGACLVGANLLNASIDDATNLEGAIFCRTLMPDGSINDDDCDKGSRCCPTPETCEAGSCEGVDCTDAYFAECSVIGFPAPFCCEPAVCTPSIFGPVLTRCQVPCDNDDYCRSVVGGNSVCLFDFIFCPFIGNCCQIP